MAGESSINATIKVLLLIVLAAFILLQVFTRINEYFGDIIQIKVSGEDTSKVLDTCKKLESVFFARDYFNEIDTDQFKAYFESRNDDGLYAKTILFCGALVEIVEITSGRNINETIENINQDYRNFNIQISADQINTIISQYDDPAKQEMEFEKYLATEIKSGLGDYYG